jgi:hypothetical protein
MNIEQIIKLIDAGYTKEDIEKMNQSAADPAKTDQAKTDPAKTDPAKTDPAKTDPAEKPKEKNPESEPVNAQMLKELQDLKKAVYAMNIMQSSQPDKTDSVDDILAKALKEG